MKCDKCEKEFNVTDLWTLTYLGTFCKECALYILGYWIINAESVVKKIEGMKK